MTGPDPDGEYGGGWQGIEAAWERRRQRESTNLPDPEDDGSSVLEDQGGARRKVAADEINLGQLAEQRATGIRWRSQQRTPGENNLLAERYTVEVPALVDLVLLLLMDLQDAATEGQRLAPYLDSDLRRFRR